MDNLTATRCLCNAMANTFYPDDATVELALLNAGVDASCEATAKDAALFRAALGLVMGYVEGSHGEGGVSVAVRDTDSLFSSVRFWCGAYGLDPAEELSGYVREIEDGSHLW